MTKQKESFADKVFRFSIPHVLVLILMIILICCGLTYIVPAGLYEIDAQTGMVVPNSFHWVESSPISPWRALVEVTNGVASQGVIFALLFIMGGLIYVVIESGAVNNVINYSVYKLQDKKYHGVGADDCCADVRDWRAGRTGFLGDFCAGWFIAREKAAFG